MLISTNAIVLKRIPYSDTSLICRLFTKDRGKVTILAKGVWKPKQSTGALLEPISHIHIQYYHKNSRDIQILKDAGFIQHYSALRNSLNRIILGLAIVEMIDKSTQDSNPHPVLYRLIWRVLKKLNSEDQNYWGVFAFFLYHLSLRLGFMPNLSNCNKCNSKMLKGGIDTSTGELVCSGCFAHNENQLNNFSALNKLTSIHLDELNTLLRKNIYIIDSIHLLNAFLSYHVEGFKKVKSMEMVRSILNEEDNKIYY